MAPSKSPSNSDKRKAASERAERTFTTKEARLQLRQAALESALSMKAAVEAIESRQVSEEGEFTDEVLTQNNLLRPHYDPKRLMEIVEGSAILPQCIEAMVENVDGFGHKLMFVGDSSMEDSEEAENERKSIDAFFRQVNEDQSFVSLRKELRRDCERTGNAYMEVLRYPDGEIAALYRMEARYTRLQAKQKERVEIKVPLIRGGKVRETTLKKRFRRFCMVTNTASKQFRWFKQYGDPRVMCAVTGKYEDQLRDGEKIIEPASEVIHFKIGNETYGIPRWVGVTSTVLGLSSADYVNYDLFDNQVVPPLAIMVSGGGLTQESVEDIKDVLLQKKGVENFNKVLILEAKSEGSIDDKSSARIELKELSAARKDDAMFTEYTDKGETRTRCTFRLPPLYIGRSDSYSKSTADSSKMVAEEQVFVPARQEFDEVVNLFFLQREFGAKFWKFRSKGPRLIAGADVIEGFGKFSRAGVLTINEGIRIANEVLGLDVQTYDEKWGNYPIPIVNELAKQGVLSDLEEITTATGDIIDLLEGVDYEALESSEKAEMVYRLFTGLRRKLSKFSDEREDEINELDGEM